ncbi:hypothetical protein [Arthrobacter sp. JCM 19049]
MKWSIHGDGKSITPGEVVAPDERLHWPQTISIGTQHILRCSAPPSWCPR